MYFSSRYELGRTLSQRVAHLKGEEAIVLCLKDGRPVSEQAKAADEKLQQQRSEVTEKQNEAKQQRNGDTPEAQTGDTSGEQGEDGTAAENTSTPSKEQLQQLQDQHNQNVVKLQLDRSGSRSAEQYHSTDNSQRDYSQKTW